MSDDDDPFAPEADPYPPDEPFGFTRRAVFVGSVAVVALAGTAGCASLRIGCVSVGEVRSEPCAHRFCRYGRARVLGAEPAR